MLEKVMVNDLQKKIMISCCRLVAVVPNYLHLLFPQVFLFNSK